ncbi:hypothetical protein MA5S0422_2855 [Mycobacteroides abscessus 5S-0422]|nr:hypothetical protein MA5S0304_1918 [Mycobacteroides abscessus 5S-0304]EIU12665.1 hypothetical protein MA5S0421_2172 [Mycobacteroides abscessus 5S-0421]EIU13252.1 hypothetical protein MA5S0422_2855 [Mycobacteroides abscessus 5S-0422]EIU20831.1 hypothetical protein MA5S0708_4939 [Mycobacteroides abscessus 5S-0708]EIU25064.1 hypothetical protein MA5S0817_5112 [Mycobacteroides abscessus 5S-0817]EIU29864.1 hypothetical protein MA5S1212_4500 [Mycobacteroides abscessus 5S-1212]EIU45137.1 hypothet
MLHPRIGSWQAVEPEIALSEGDLEYGRGVRAVRSEER